MRERLTLVFLIDALGFEQAGSPEFLPLLDRPRAPVRSILGYSSAAIPTILTGVPPERHGHLSMYRRAGRNGIFRSVAPWIGLATRLTDRRWRLGRWITSYLKNRGITGYFSLYEIPLRWLPQFDLCQRRDIYAPGAFDGIPGLADHLEQRGRSRIWSWRVPEAQAFRELEEEVERGNNEFLFLYTAELDTVMHATGPASGATRDKLAGYDRRITSVIRQAEKTARRVRVFIFGDHGMAPVQQQHDLWASLRTLPFQVPGDWLYFLDSTMARFWFANRRAEQEVDRLLAGLGWGRVLDDPELRRLGSFFPDREYGERIFLADEGHIIVPSFMSAQVVRGMHGYHPDDRCSFTTLVTNAHDRPYPADLIDLHALLRAEILEAAP